MDYIYSIPKEKENIQKFIHNKWCMN